MTAANQPRTHDGWEHHRGQFALYVSQFVIEAASAGAPDAATRRFAVLADLPALDGTDAVPQLAHALLTHVPLPANAQVEALHLAVATVHGMAYRVTWNCTPIAKVPYGTGLRRCAVLQAMNRQLFVPHNSHSAPRKLRIKRIFSDSLVAATRP